MLTKTITRSSGSINRISQNFLHPLGKPMPHNRPKGHSVRSLFYESYKPFVSVEFFPPKTEAGVSALHKAINHYKKYNIQFADLTWGAGGSTSDMTINLCKDMRRHGLNPNMHLTCTNMPVEKVDFALASCKESGITNILALRGDPPVGETLWKAAEGGLASALDLVKYIRRKYDNFFKITVAAYPEGHPTAMTVFDGTIAELTKEEKTRFSVEWSEDAKRVINVCRDDQFKNEMAYLKEKIDAGASMIITQMFFDVEVFKAFVVACRSNGINVPIIPGIMSISSYNGFKRTIKFCKTRVPRELEIQVEALKDNPIALKALGIEFGVKLCKELLDFGVEGLHFYTLNTVGVTTAIMEQLGYLPSVKFTKSESVETI